MEILCFTTSSLFRHQSIDLCKHISLLWKHPYLYQDLFPSNESYLTLLRLSEYLLGLFGTCKSYAQTFSGLGFYLQSNTLLLYSLFTKVWNVEFSPALIFLVLLWYPYHPWLCIFHQTTTWGKHSMCTLNSAVPLLAAQPSPCLGYLDIGSIAHGVMSGCVLKLHTIINDTQRGFNDFSIHQLQYNLSWWQSVAPTVTYFSTLFCLGFYIFDMCQQV